ncbi:MAG: hypothetical protein ACRDTH_25860 [Pseudonocardiaceae bacterium]
MTRRQVVFIRIEQLLDIHERRQPAFFVDWRCRLCRFNAGALDRTAALDAAATHLHDAHRAHGGRMRRKT